jgi:hypothetical protein
MNFNDAEITSLYVSDPGNPLDIENDAPNAPGGGGFNVTLEMVAGPALTGPYTVAVTCSDLTLTATAAAPLIPANPGPLNGPGNFGAAPWWTPAGPLANVFNQTVPVGPEPPADAGHIYQYTAALYSSNGQIVSIKQSDPFILV